MNSKQTVKNVTFAIGLALLIYGALNAGIRDWDVGVSLVMAVLTYATADWVVGVVRRLEYKQWLKAAFLTWVSVIGSHTAYWMLMGHPDYHTEYQWQVSLSLYLLFGVICSALPTPRESLVLARSMKAGFSSSLPQK